MVKELRRKEKAMDEGEIDRVLAQGGFGVLSMGGGDYPYGIPLNYVYAGEAIYFHCAMAGHKLELLAVDNKVSFCIVGKVQLLPEKFSTKFESVIVYGRIVEVEDEEKTSALLALIEKYSREFVEKGKLYIEKDAHKTKVLKLCVEYKKGKIN